MKKLWIPIFLLALTLPGISQGRKYQKAMVKGLEKNAEAQGSAFLESAAHFHEIADDHPGQAPARRLA